MSSCSYIYLHMFYAWCNLWRLQKKVIWQGFHLTQLISVSCFTLRDSLLPLFWYFCEICWCLLLIAIVRFTSLKFSIPISCYWIKCLYKVHLNCEYFLLQLLTSLIKFNIASVWDIAEQLHCVQSEYLEYNFVD